MTPEKREQRFSAEEISPLSMSYFLKKQEPGLNFVGNPSYSAIFASLRTLPCSRQEELLVNFFDQTIRNFHNGQRLGHFLANANNVPWFRPQGEPNLKELQQFSNGFYQRLGFRSLPLRIIRDDWGTAWETLEQAKWSKVWGKVLDAVGASREESQSPTRILALNIGWSITRQAVHEAVLKTGAGPRLAKDVARQTALASAWSAVWIIAEDSIPKKVHQDNPFVPLFEEIYDKGYWFIGPVGKKSVIFVPEIKKAA
jgi:hypothetical protein